MIKLLYESIYYTLSSRKHLLIAVALALAMAFISIIIPSLLTPGTTIKYQFSILQANDFGLILLFSSLFGIAIAMQVYASDREKTKGKLAKNTGTSLVAFVGTLFSAKLCPLCLGAILSIFGIGGSAALFLFSYKSEIIVASIFILLLIIYFTGLRVEKIKSCKNC